MFLSVMRWGRLAVLSVAACAGCAGAAAPGGTWLAVQDDTASREAAESKDKAAPPRRIITKASFTAETSDMDRLSQALSDQVALSGGFIAGFNEQRYAGQRRGGTWTIRMPSEHFEPFVLWLDQHVTVTGRELSSQDVSEEFVDLEARLANKKNTEQRLTKLLEDRAGKLDDILGVEREIDRVREEIERLEGRRRFLQDRISLCTITLTVTTRLEAQVVQAPAFVTRIAETWSASVTGVRECAEGLALVAVALVPWLPILLAIGYLFYRALRWLRDWTLRLVARPSAP